MLSFKCWHRDIVQLVAYLSTVHEVLGSVPDTTQTSVVVYCNSSIWELEAGGSEVQGQLDMVVHTFNVNTLEAEAGGSV